MKQRAPERTPVVAVGWCELVLWLCGKRQRVRVEGDSMHPTLVSGETVLVRPTSHVRPNDIVLCRHPYKVGVQLIKRVEISDTKGVFLLGDAPAESTDSRSFGVVPWSHLVGVVTSKMP